MLTRPLILRVIVKRANILLVEGNSKNAGFVRELLKNLENFEPEVVLADRMSCAKHCLENKPFDIVLLALRLPGGMGIKNCVAIKKLFPKVPVIITAGRLEEKSMAMRCLRHGAHDYLFKQDLSVKNLDRTIAFALERKRQEEIRENFINMVSHEMNSPLSVIHGSVENLKDGLAGPMNPKQKEVLATVTRNIGRMLNLSQDILYMAKLTLGQVRVQKKSVDLKPLIQEAMSDLRIKSPRKEVVLEKNYSGPTTAKGNSALIQKILSNLLNNANHFAREKITVQTKKTATGLQISVIDDGKGIPQKLLGGLFNKFAQISPKEKTKGYSGTGLGLAICKEIVELHGGKIWVESPDRPSGKGSAFHLLLPGT